MGVNNTQEAAACLFIGSSAPPPTWAGFTAVCHAEMDPLGNEEPFISGVVLKEHMKQPPESETDSK